MVIYEFIENQWLIYKNSGVPGLSYAPPRQWSGAYLVTIVLLSVRSFRAFEISNTQLLVNYPFDCHGTGPQSTTMYRCSNTMCRCGGR